MSDDQIKAAHAEIVAREAAWIRLINGWNSNEKATGFPVLDADSVPAGASARSQEGGGFPVLFESLEVI